MQESECRRQEKGKRIKEKERHSDGSKALRPYDAMTLRPLDPINPINAMNAINAIDPAPF